MFFSEKNKNETHISSLKSIFNKYSDIQINDEKFMSYKCFVKDYLKLHQNEKLTNMIGSAVNFSKSKKISFLEFATFESILKLPDSIYLLAFQLFDQSHSGSITFKEFKNVIDQTTLFSSYPINYSSYLFDFYFGKKRDKEVSFLEFTQFLKDFYTFNIDTIFKKLSNGSIEDGSISLEDSVQCIYFLKKRFLSVWLKENLHAVAETSHLHAYTFYKAFLNLLENFQTVNLIFRNHTSTFNRNEINKDTFLTISKNHDNLSLCQIEVLFSICKLLNPSQCLDESVIQEFSSDVNLTPSLEAPHSSIFDSLIDNSFRFLLGSVAGGCGATFVYPIDLVKTRMQNQRKSHKFGEVMYKNSFHCFQKVLKHEGVLGFYKGLLPQIMGVAPEKAIKLTTNDLVRDLFRQNKSDASISKWCEVVAGGCAGASQVMFTNPIEIIKIRLQVAGEVRGQASKINAVNVMKELGFTGLYKGSRACFLRDIPFSAIFFPLYAHCKMYFLYQKKWQSESCINFASGLIAGAPAAGLMTPADVVKTRLQVAARAGQTTYTGVVDCFRKIILEEGLGALWKGSLARVFRSSPQFAATMGVYDYLHSLFLKKEFVKHSKTTVKSISDATGDLIGGYQSLGYNLKELDRKFGIRLI